MVETRDALVRPRVSLPCSAFLFFSSFDLPFLSPPQFSSMMIIMLGLQKAGNTGGPPTYRSSAHHDEAKTKWTTGGPEKAKKRQVMKYEITKKKIFAFHRSSAACRKYPTCRTRTRTAGGRGGGRSAHQFAHFRITVLRRFKP